MTSKVNTFGANRGSYSLHVNIFSVHNVCNNRFTLPVMSKVKYIK